MTPAPRRLVDSDPSWITRGDRIIGVVFACPFGPDAACGGYHGVPFANPPDGGPPDPWAKGQGWQRTGETFEDLTLTPSILDGGACRWHGFITCGEVTSV